MIVLFSTVLKKANLQMKSLYIQLEISNIPKLTLNLKQKNSKLWNRSERFIPVPVEKKTPSHAVQKQFA